MILKISNLISFMYFSTCCTIFIYRVYTPLKRLMLFQLVLPVCRAFLPALLLQLKKDQADEVGTISKDNKTWQFPNSNTVE